MARGLGELGYVAFALDYHGGGERMTDRDEMLRRFGVLNVDRSMTRRLAAAGLDQLLAEQMVDETKVAAIGYCFGGTMALELGRSGADIHVIVGFHAGLSTPDPGDARKIRGRVLMCIGADDPIVDPAERLAFEAEMRAARIDWQLVVYGGAQHTFTNPAAVRADLPGFAYHPVAAARSWRAMLDLFDETFGPAGTLA